jgi:hypothetical protein
MSAGASAAGVDIDLTSASGADAAETTETAKIRAVRRRRKENAGAENENKRCEGSSEQSEECDGKGKSGLAVLPRSPAPVRPDSEVNDSHATSPLPAAAANGPRAHPFTQDQTSSPASLSPQMSSARRPVSAHGARLDR